MFRAATLLAALLLIMAGPACLNAQSVSGELTGTVYDSTGAAIPTAAVTATNTETSVQTTAVTPYPLDFDGVSHGRGMFTTQSLVSNWGTYE